MPHPPGNRKRSANAPQLHRQTEDVFDEKAIARIAEDEMELPADLSRLNRFGQDEGERSTGLTSLKLRHLLRPVGSARALDRVLSAVVPP